MKEWIIKYIYLPTGRIRKSTIISKTKEKMQECFEESHSNYKILSVEQVGDDNE